MNYKSQTFCWTTFRPKRRAGSRSKNGSIGNRHIIVCVACGSSILPKQAGIFVDTGVYATLLGRFGRCRCGCPWSLALHCGAADREGVAIQDGAVHCTVYFTYVFICISDHMQHVRAPVLPLTWTAVDSSRRAPPFASAVCGAC
jgi:hypothetical protein